MFLNSKVTKTVVSLGITTVSELLQITLEDITNFQYFHGDSSMTKIQYSITIDCLQGYMLNRKESNDPVGQSWFSIIAEDIDEYVMTDHYFSYTNRPIYHSDPYTQTTGNVHEFKNDPNVKEKRMGINI